VVKTRCGLDSRIYGVYIYAHIQTFLSFQGDRFGGALDGAARQFSEAYDAGLHPMEFVNSMRKKGQLIMGIGHRVKSVSKHR
jgi:citrate synthase